MFSIKDHKNFARTGFSVEDINMWLKAEWTTEKRRVRATLVMKYFDSNARKAKEIVGWNVDSIKKGIREIEKWKADEDQRKWGNRKRWEDKIEWLWESIKKIVEPHTQTDPTFKTKMLYVKVTIPKVREKLEEEWYSWDNIPSERSLYYILRRLWYSIKKVQKSKPKKK